MKCLVLSVDDKALCHLVHGFLSLSLLSLTAVCAWNILPPDACMVQPLLSGLFKHHFISKVFSNHPVKRTLSTAQSFDLTLCFSGALDLLCVYQHMCLPSVFSIILLPAISPVLSTAPGTISIWWIYEGIDPNMLDWCYPVHQIPSLWLVVFTLFFLLQQVLCSLIKKTNIWETGIIGMICLGELGQGSPPFLWAPFTHSPCHSSPWGGVKTTSRGYSTQFL